MADLMKKKLTHFYKKKAPKLVLFFIEIFNYLLFKLLTHIYLLKTTLYVNTKNFVHPKKEKTI